MKRYIKCIKKNKMLYSTLDFLRKRIIQLWILCCCAFSKSRKASQSIKKFENIHEKSRCFIIATGPSLTLEDLQSLKNEYTFSMNSIVKLFSKTDFRPTYYVIQDGIAENKIRKSILANKMENVFVGVGDVPLYSGNISPKVVNKYYPSSYHYNLCTAYHFYEVLFKAKNKPVLFSDNCAKAVYDGFTVTYSAIQLAVYMGFKEIYLVGCDTNSSGHIDDAKSKISGNSIEAFLKAYRAVAPAIARKDVRIFNATRGGALEVFERKDLDEILNADTENK